MIGKKVLGKRLDVATHAPPNEAARRLFLCVAHMGGQQAVADWLDLAPNTLHQYLTQKRAPTLANAVKMQRRSNGLIPVEVWLDKPVGVWPPHNLGAAFERLARRLKR